MPPSTEAFNAQGGTLEATAVTAYTNFGNQMASGILELTVEADYGAYNPPLLRFTPVTVAVVPTRFRTQRRRRIGVGS